LLPLTILSLPFQIHPFSPAASKKAATPEIKYISSAPHYYYQGACHFFNIFLILCAIKHLLLTPKLTTFVGQISVSDL